MALRPGVRLTLVLLALALGAPSLAAPPDYSKSFDGNRLRCTVSNVGTLGRPPEQGGLGIEYPQKSGRDVFARAGLWLAGKIQFVTTCAIADFNTEFQTGP